jgi:hypothetical protein
VQPLLRPLEPEQLALDLDAKTPSLTLDDHTCEIGRRGIARARARLAELEARSQHRRAS